MVTAFLVTFAISVVYIYWLLKFKKDKRLPPGPPQWPLIGNVVELGLADPKYPHLAMVNLAKKYGDVFSIKVGVHDACVVTSFEAYKDIYSREETQGRYPLPFVPDRSFHKILGIIWGNGALWRELRKYTVKGLREFGFGKLKSMDTVIQEEVSDMITFLKSNAKSHNGVVDMNPHDFAGSVVNILWSMVAGYKFPIGDKTVHQILEHGNRISEVTSQSNIYNAFPELRHWFPKLTSWDKHMNSHTEYQEFVKGMILKARDQRAGRQDQEAQNFIEIFLDEIDKNVNNPNSIFNEEQLIVVLQDLFLAGSETTGTAMTWSMLFIVLNPRVEQKLRNEVYRLFPNRGQSIPIADLKKLTYMRATLYEIFRMADIAAIPPPRMAMEDINYKGYTIPKGTLLIASMHNILTEKKHWGDPETFRPERFLDESGTKIVNSEHCCTFGMGKRICMGETLVWDAMSMYLAEILRNFTFETIPGKEPTPNNPNSSGTLTPQRYSLIFKPTQ